MGKVTGVFEGFKDLGTITADELNRWLPSKIEAHIIENFLANRILYPQTVPMNSQEIEIDFAILREAIRKNPGFFWDRVKNTLTLPKVYLERFPTNDKLILSFLDVLPLEGVTRILIKDTLNKKVAGSILTIPGSIPFEYTVSGKKHLQPASSVTRFDLNIKSSIVQIGPKAMAVFGGSLGVFVDSRKKA